MVLMVLHLLHEVMYSLMSFIMPPQTYMREISQRVPCMPGCEMLWHKCMIDSFILVGTNTLGNTDGIVNHMLHHGEAGAASQLLHIWTSSLSFTQQLSR